MLTMAKLMSNVDGAVSQAPLAAAALHNAMSALRIGFGAGSVSELEAQDMLKDLERTIYLLQQHNASTQGNALGY